MQELAPLVKDLTIILGIASAVTLLFQKIRQPVVLGYLVAGMIIGPHTPPNVFIQDIHSIETWSGLGVIFLMFALGLDFSFHKLKRVGFSASITGFIEVVLMLLLGLATGRLIGWSFYDSLFLGAALGISSTTIIIKALEELNLKGKRFAEIVFGILIVEDLLAILLLVGLSLIIATNDIFSLTLVWAAIKLVAVVGCWFLVGYFAVPPLFRRIMHYVSEETLTIVSIALCLMLVCAANYFHYSTALGAFIMGSILAETSLIHRIESLIRPIRDIFAAIFFVSVGMLIDPSIIWAQLPIVLLLCVVTIAGKMLITGGGALLTGQSFKNALRIGSSMAQIGEFSFIIAGLGLSLKATSGTLYPTIVAVSAVTTFTTPYLIRLSNHFSGKLEENLPIALQAFLKNYASWLYRVSASSKQQSIYGKAFARLLINGIIVGIIFILVEQFLLPKISPLIYNLWLAKVFGWLIALVCASPFIWGMLVSFRTAMLNVESQPGRATPVLYLTWIATIIEIIIFSIHFFETKWVALFLICLALIFFSLMHKQLDKSYHWFEKRLMHNLKNNSLPQRYEELAPWDAHLMEIEVPWQSELAHRTLAHYELRQQFGINIVAIYRGSTAIFSPRGHQMILPFDKLILLGSDEQIEKFTKRFIKKTTVQEQTDPLENFALKAILLEADNALVGFSIRDSGLREKVTGQVVGLERNGVRFLNPDVTTVLTAGDLVFVVGEKSHLQNI